MIELFITKNVDAYRNSVSEIDFYKRKVKSEIKQIETEKEKTFNPKLASFDRNVQNYRNGRLNLGDYLQILDQYSRNSPSIIKKFISALNLETSLNLSQIEIERGHLLSQLMSKLKAADTSELMAASVAYRSGHINHADFYQYLSRLCKTMDVPLAQFPTS